MKRIGIALFISAVAMQAAADWDEYAPLLQNESGDAIMPEALSDKLTFVAVWATWCTPCLPTLPYVEALHNINKDNPDVAVLTIHVEKKRKGYKSAATYIARKNFGFPVVYDTESEFTRAVGTYAEIVVIPQYFLISPEGDVIQSYLKLDKPTLIDIQRQFDTYTYKRVSVTRPETP